MSGAIGSHREGHVLSLVFDRPDKRNAFTVDMYRDLAAALDDAGEDAGVRAVLLRGAGGAFTSGNDVGDFLRDPPQSADHPVMRFLHRLAGFEKPVVAAVEGPAVGIGTTLLLHCDLVLAAADARFRMPFVPMGLVPEGGSSLLLPRLVGPQRAAELLLLGEVFDAVRAADLGLVNEVLEDGARLIARAEERAAQLAALPPEAVRQAKALLRGASADEVHRTLDAEAAVFARRLTSAEAREAMTAFMDRRARRS